VNDAGVLDLLPVGVPVVVAVDALVGGVWGLVGGCSPVVLASVA
jgi:hypothetical protein